MIVLGIDPGIERTGIGIVEKLSGNQFRPVWYGIITTPKTDDHAVRLETIEQDLKEILSNFKPKVIGIEELFFTTNKKSAMAVAEARGIITLTCHKNNIPFETFSPNEIKSIITGSGIANKTQVARAVCQLLKISEAPKPDDITDALAIAICTGLSYK